MKLAANVRRVQFQHNLTNNDMARITGLHRGTISRIHVAAEEGEGSYNPTLRTLRALQKAMQLKGIDTLIQDKLVAN